jgi:hypothetical protein
MNNVIPNSTPCWRVAASAVDSTIKVHVDPIIAWKTAAYLGAPLVPVCVTAGEVKANTKHPPPSSFIITELSAAELLPAIVKMAFAGWPSEIWSADAAGLRWKIGDTVYSLSRRPGRINKAPEMTREQMLEFVVGRGGSWDTTDGADDDQAAKHASILDAYAAIFRGERLPDAIKFVPVSVGELFAAPKTEAGAPASAQAEAG